MNLGVSVFDPYILSSQSFYKMLKMSKKSNRKFLKNLGEMMTVELFQMYPFNWNLYFLFQKTLFAVFSTKKFKKNYKGSFKTEIMIDSTPET